MTIWIDNRSSEPFPQELAQAVEKMIIGTLEYEGFQRPCEVSVSIVEDAEIRQINRQFRDIDRATDVLSFPLLSFQEGEIPDTNEKDEVLLGDIIISLERARAQAQEYGHSLKREIAFLTAHSMLHLLGYDHMTEDEEKEMFRRQRDILLSGGIPRE